MSCHMAYNLGLLATIAVSSHPAKSAPRFDAAMPSASLVLALPSHPEERKGVCAKG